MIIRPGLDSRNSFKVAIATNEECFYTSKPRMIPRDVFLLFVFCSMGLNGRVWRKKIEGIINKS